MLDAPIGITAECLIDPLQNTNGKYEFYINSKQKQISESSENWNFHKNLENPKNPDPAVTR